MSNAPGTSGSGTSGSGTSGRDREYDRFGPWVLEVSDEDPPPPRFLPYLTRTRPALVSIKIPRKIARRDAHPGMDLYDYVVSLYEDDMVILKRVGSEVQTETLAYGDIRYVNLREDLLRGNLHLGVAGHAYDLPYNTVSSDVVRPLAERIRERYRPSPADPSLALPSATVPGEMSFYFERLLKDERDQRSTMRPLASQATIGLGSLESGRPRKLVFGIVDKRLLESIHFCDGHELRVIDRGQPFAYRWQTVYGRRETFIPLPNITAVVWRDDTADGTTTALTVRTSGGDNSWVFSRTNAGLAAYGEWLNELTATRRR